MQATLPVSRKGLHSSGHLSDCLSQWLSQPQHPFLSCLSAQWVCNFCKHEGAVPHTYQCPLDAAGLRRDREQRAELCRGSVDFAVPKVRNGLYN